MLILLSVCPAKSVHLIICECEQRFCVHYLIKRFGGYRNKLYICKQEQKRNEYAKEYKKEKQNGHLPCDAPCEHRTVHCSLGICHVMQGKESKTCPCDSLYLCNLINYAV